MKTGLGILVLFLLSAVALSGCGEKSDATPDEEKRAVPVEVRAIEKGTFVSSLEAIGRVESEKEVRLDFEVGGKIEAIFYGEGAEVDSGEIISRIEQVQYRARYDQARAAMKKAEIDLASSKKLMKQNTISRDFLEKAEVAYESARSAYLLAQEALNDTELKAPFSGFIVSKSVEEGELSSPGGIKPPAFIFADMRHLKTEVSIPESDVGVISAGQQAFVRVSSHADKIYEGRVKRVSLAAAERSNTFKAEVLLPNPNLELRIGMVADVEIIYGVHEGEIVISLDSVLQDDESSHVFRVVDGMARRVNVKVMGVKGERAWVKGELSEGDLLVVLGQGDLSDGVKVSYDSNAE